MGDLFQQLLNKVGRSYGQADKNLFGGLLPGGAARQKPEQSKWKQDVGITNTTQEKPWAASPGGIADKGKSWAASPGEFADKGSFQNGLDAINKTGASIIGFLGGNANDIELVRRFYTKNPQVANQYDLPVNLFLRYMSGIGAKDLAVSQEQGLRIIESIKKRRQDSPEAIERAEQDMVPAAAASYKRQIAKGMIPVYSYAADNQEVGNSLGRFWAEPQKDSSFVITEDFNFGYAPSSKGGDDKRAKLFGMGSPLTIDPMLQANRLVTGGHGTPFRYRLRVYPDGRVEPINTP